MLIQELLFQKLNLLNMIRNGEKKKRTKFIKPFEKKILLCKIKENEKRIYLCEAINITQ